MPREPKGSFRCVLLFPGWLNGGSAQSALVAKGSRSVEPLLVPGRRTRPVSAALGQPERQALVSRLQAVVPAELVAAG
jgi:hypothetical protein